MAYFRNQAHGGNPNYAWAQYGGDNMGVQISPGYPTMGVSGHHGYQSAGIYNNHAMHSKYQQTSMFPPSAVDMKDGQQDIWIREFPKHNHVTSPAEPRKQAKMQVPVSANINTASRDKDVYLGGDEDLLAFLERPLLFEDVNQLMVVDSGLYTCDDKENNNKPLGQFDKPDYVSEYVTLTTTSYEDTMDDLQDVICKDMSSDKIEYSFVFGDVVYAGQGSESARSSPYGSLTPEQEIQYADSSYVGSPTSSGYTSESSMDSHGLPSSSSHLTPLHSLPATSILSLNSPRKTERVIAQAVPQMVMTSPFSVKSEMMSPFSVKSEPVSPRGSWGSDTESDSMSSASSVSGSCSPPSSYMHDKGVRPKRRRGQHLWEFILEVIRDPRYNPSIIKWLDEKQGVFKIVRSQEVAKLWGQRKGNSTMSYEYMSRAMRHYYNNGILNRVFGKRLVYQFGNRAYGWDEPTIKSEIIIKSEPLSPPSSPAPTRTASHNVTHI